MTSMNKKRNRDLETGSLLIRGKDRKQETRNSSNKDYIIYFIVAVVVLSFISFSNSSCNVYKFHDIAIPDSIKTIKINFIENRAPYVNPLLSPRLTDRLRQKIVSQTRLSQTNNDNADWDINGYISNYTSSTSGISNQQVATNRLTVTVHVSVNDQKANKTQEYDVSRNFEYSATKSLTQAESELADEIIRGLTDDIFNRIFSNW
ncbi:MAG TPA: LptE family protein [Chitinophagaceae bacterium]|nr:LptE family protein [Chitinophagaceae bacterium]